MATAELQEATQSAERQPRSAQLDAATYADALQVLTTLGNGPFGRKRAELAAANSPLFEEVRTLEQELLTACSACGEHAGTTTLTGPDRKKLNRLRGILDGTITTNTTTNIWNRITHGVGRLMNRE